jgi:hypothetical protein
MIQSRLRVTCFLPSETDLDRLEQLDPDREPAPFVRGERAWIRQTFLRLRAAGHPVELAPTPPGEGLVVYHAGRPARPLVTDEVQAITHLDRHDVLALGVEDVKQVACLDRLAAEVAAHAVLGPDDV